MALPFLIRCAVCGTGLLWAAASAFGAAGAALIRTFDAVEAPIKEAVRSVIVARDGTLIVGSNELAAYDGHRWQKIDVPAAYGFRALDESPSLGRVFVGGIDTLGYIERDTTGTWRFTRLNSGLTVGDVWSVHTVGHGAVWVGTDRVFRWRGERIETLALPNPTQLAGFSEGDATLIYQEGTGLLRVGLTGAAEVLVRDSELPQKPVTWLVAAPDEAGPSSRLIGLRDGAYRWDGGKQFVRVDALSTALRGSIPTSAARLADGRVAVGTFNAGIVIASRDGEVIGRVGKADGLGPGNVFALTVRGAQLWAALPEGLARIDAPGQAKRFDRRQDLDEGTPRRALAASATEYLLTSSGLFESAASGVERRATFAKPAWNAVHAANAVWIGGFGGIWRAEGGKVEQVHYVSTDVLTLAASPRVPDGVMFTEGYALKALLPSPHGGWAARELGFRATDTPVSLVDDGEGHVWLATMQAGIFQLRWVRERDESLHLQFVSHCREQFGINVALTRPRLTLLHGTLFVLAEEGVYRLRDDRAGFTAVRELADFVGIAATEAGVDGSAYWLVRHRALGALGAFAVVRVKRADGGELRIERVDVPGLDTGAWTGIDAVGGAVWLTGSRGAIRVAGAALTPAAQPPAVHLTGVRWQDDAGSGPRGVVLTFPAETASNGAAMFYQTRLMTNGDEAWSPPIADSQREFSSLAPGSYVFEARAFDRFGRNNPPISYAFSIPLPWWRTAWAWTGYGLTLLLVIAGSARWRIKRLQLQNERLNRLVSDRTRELELSNTAKSEFLENISHEIRNPLNGLTGLLTLLKEERMEPEERARVKSLRAVTSTLTRVFEDVLQFSKLEYGYAQLHPRPFRLRKTLDELLALFATTAQAQDCALSLGWPAELADGFVGDEDKIRTVVGNFISNALKYAPGAPVEIHVMATEERDGHVDLYIDVIDHGRGIPAEEQGLIFKKFVRGTRAKEEEIPGTGLGLATCNVLARLMNGQVSVESVPGKGATFSLRMLLPRAPDGALTTPSEANEVAKEGDRPRALIVDDEPYNRTVLEGLAGELGFRADLTGNAREAMECVERNSYQVIFLDWELPGLKGGDVARQIRARPAGGEPIIFATTAHDSDEMQERCREAGMDGFLLKPFYAAAIRRALDGVTAWRRERNESSAKSNFWSENPVHRGTELDLRAFDQYERARPNQPGNARADFIRTLEEQMAALEGALAEGDSATVAGTAHRLRALAGLIHAEELNAAATKLEELARKGSDEQRAFQTKITLAAGQALRAKLDSASGR